MKAKDSLIQAVDWKPSRKKPSKTHVTATKLVPMSLDELYLSNSKCRHIHSRALRERVGERESKNQNMKCDDYINLPFATNRKGLCGYSAIHLTNLGRKADVCLSLCHQQGPADNSTEFWNRTSAAWDFKKTSVVSSRTASFFIALTSMLFMCHAYCMTAWILKQRSETILRIWTAAQYQWLGRIKNSLSQKLTNLLCLSSHSCREWPMH